MDNATAAVSPFTTRTEFDQAVDQAAQAARAYYDQSGLAMPDADYDTLVDRIAATKTLHPDWDDQGVTTEVAAGQSAGGDVPHPSPMLSLDKVTDTEADHDKISDIEEFTRFLDQCGSGGYTVEVKLDGNAIRAVYNQGRLIQAVTRGNGTAGEDVTANVLRAPGIAGLPATLDKPFTGEVRGEVFMTYADFDAASENRVEAGGKPFANPRNATSGSLRALNRTYEAVMSFGAYNIDGWLPRAYDNATTNTLHTHTERMRFAESLGFTTAAMLTPGGSAYCDAPTTVKAKIVDIKTARDTLGFPIDGAVIAYDHDTERAKAGTGNKHPLWARAWKYPAREGSTTVEGLDLAIGRTGRLSLTLRLTPLYLDGSTVSRASGHNPIWLAASGLGVGMTALLVKRGDIIPYASLLDAPQPADATPFVLPETCPNCDQAWDKTSKLWRCHSPECSVAGRLNYALSGDAWDVDGFGTAYAEALAENGTVADSLHALADLFFLTEEQWATLPLGETKDGNIRTVGVKNARKVMTGLEKSKTLPFSRTIVALGIRTIGRTFARTLAAEYPTMDRLRKATLTDIAALDGLGEVRARFLVEGLEKMSDVIDRLALAGVNMGEEPTNDGTPKPFDGRSYVISGSIPGYTRAQAQDRIAALGGKASGSVSATTTALITTETGTSKAKKAATLGIPIIDPDDFVKMLNGDLA